MSVNVTVYTEARIDNEWVCIDHFLHYTRDGDERTVLVPVYEGASMAASALRLHGDLVREMRNNLSQTVRDRYQAYEDDTWYTFYTMPGSWFAGRNFELPEYSGFLPRQIVFDYESRVCEEIDESEFLSAAEYSALPAEAQKAYQFYEWTDPWGSRNMFRQIKAGIRQRINTFNDYARHWDGHLQKYTPKEIGWEDVRIVVDIS